MVGIVRRIREFFKDLRDLYEYLKNDDDRWYGNRAE